MSFVFICELSIEHCKNKILEAQVTLVFFFLSKMLIHVVEMNEVYGNNFSEHVFFYC